MMFFMLTLESTKKCVAQKTVTSTKKIFHTEVNVAHQNYVSHKKICCANKKTMWHPKEDSIDYIFSVAQKRNTYLQKNGSCFIKIYWPQEIWGLCIYLERFFYTEQYLIWRFTLKMYNFCAITWLSQFVAQVQNRCFFRLYLTSSPKKWDKKYIFFLIIYWLLCNKPRHFRKRKKEINDVDSQFHFQNFKSRHFFSFLIDPRY